MQIASGVSYAHARGVIHRDIKPSNILLDAAGTAWVTDFGLARDGDSGLTATEDVIGTFRYMAPERFAGHCDERSDIYSLGLTLYELLALEPAFSEHDPAMLVDAIRTHLPRPLRQFDPRMPRDLNTIVLKAIEKEPARRYASADELAADLGRFLADEPIHARRVKNSEKVYRWCRRNPALAAVSCLAIVGLLATVIILAISNRQVRDGNSALRVAVVGRDEAIAGQQKALGQREKALDEAGAQRKLAETNAARAEDLVRTMSTERGLLAGERGEMADAVLWFAEAAKLSASDEPAREANLVRAQAYATEAVRPLRLFEHTLRREGWVTKLSFSPNSRQLLSRAESIDLTWGDTRLWDLETGEPLPLPPGIIRATAAAWSADGLLLAIGDEFGRVVVINSNSREPLVDIHADGGDVIEMVFSPRVDRLAIAAGDELSLWSLSDDPQCLGRFKHPMRIAGLRYSPTGDHISSLCSDAGARLFRISSGELAAPQITRGNTWKTPSWDAAIPLVPRFINGGKTWIVFARFLDSKELGGANSMVLIDVESGTTRDVPLEGGRVVEMSPDEQYVFDAYQHAAIRKLADGSALGSYDHMLFQYAISAAFHPDGSMLLVGSGERIVRLMNVPELTPVTAPIEHAQSVSCVAVAPDGRSFATAETGALVRVWAFPGGPDKLSARFHPHALSQISFADVSRDGRYAVATGRTSKGNDLTTIRVVELATGQAVGSPLSPGGIILGTRFLRDAKQVAIVSAETSSQTDRQSMQSNSGFLYIADWQTGQPRGAARFNSEPRSVEIHPTDKELAVLCADGTVHLFRLDDLKETRTWHAHPPYPANNWYINNGHLLYSPDGQFLATCGRDNQVRDWDPKTGKLILAVVHGGQTDEAAFSSSSRYLATSSWNKNEVRVTDVTTGQLVSPLLIHPDWAYSAQFSPDERLLVTSCRDGSARVWNWRTGELVGRALEHGREVHTAKFLHDGTRVLTVSEENSARLWATGHQRRHRFGTRRGCPSRSQGHQPRTND
jgi:WD40 repeat protein